MLFVFSKINKLYIRGLRSKVKFVTQQEMIEGPSESLRPHVVLLGAGASRAALPHGDRSSRPIPLMNDLVDILDLAPILDRSSANFTNGDFESIYSQLAADPQHNAAKREIETMVYEYFSSLDLPEEATIYDRLLLSLRQGDAVFTFNWDPFLLDAYMRNAGLMTLPGIYFLHGNVRIGNCPIHDETVGAKDTCRARRAVSLSKTCRCFTLLRIRTIRTFVIFRESGIPTETLFREALVCDYFRIQRS